MIFRSWSQVAAKYDYRFSANKLDDGRVSIYDNENSTKVCDVNLINGTYQTGYNDIIEYIDNYLIDIRNGKLNQLGI